MESKYIMIKQTKQTLELLRKVVMNKIKKLKNQSYYSANIIKNVEFK